MVSKWVIIYLTTSSQNLSFSFQLYIKLKICNGIKIRIKSKYLLTSSSFSNENICHLDCMLHNNYKIEI